MVAMPLPAAVSANCTTELGYTKPGNAKADADASRSRPPPKAMAVDNARKAAFTLRLDAGRHLKLRLAAAVTGRSAQQVVTEALDAFLEGLPEIDRLAQQLPH